jgi:NAD(P)-dependent dehydrogenase (short-subunit alcohol dehydrogenase family)
MIDVDQLTNLASTTLERFRVDKKVAIVVGGSRGLGQAMALALSSAGADVCVVARSPQDLQKTVEAISKMGRVGKYIVADVSQEEEVEKLVGQA